MQITLRQRRNICVLLLLYCFFGGVSDYALAQRDLRKSILGRWKLTFLESKETRDIEFKTENGELIGYYYRKDGERIEISDIEVYNNELHFTLDGLTSRFWPKKGKLYGMIRKAHDSKEFFDVIMIKK